MSAASTTATDADDQARELTMTPEDLSLERRLSLIILALTPILFLFFLAITPPVNPTFDDAKYIGVGRNFIDGNGPITVFGVVFLKHSPLWPMIITIPEKLVGIHPVATGHFINAMSGVATILLVGFLGWRVRPAIGAVAAVLFAALPYVFDIARTAGIDLPSIALTLLYIVVGFSVVRTGALWRAVVLGAIFAVAFLIKETILPFAIVPFILGAMWGVRWTTIVRTAAVTLAVASVGMSWWFVMYAGYTHEVYRADFPEWTLVPSAIAVVVILVLGLAAEPIARAIDRRGWDAAAARRIPARLRDRTVLGWLAVLVWFILLTIFFGRTPKLLGASLFDPRQLYYMVVNSLGSVRLAFAYGLGTFLLVAELIRDRRRVAQASVDALVPMLCGIPLVLLVVGVGETPRHYIAELALVILTGTIGWYHGLIRLRERDRFTAGLFSVLVALAVVILAASTLQRITPKVILGRHRGPGRARHRDGGDHAPAPPAWPPVSRPESCCSAPSSSWRWARSASGPSGSPASRCQRDEGDGRHDRLADGQRAQGRDGGIRAIPEHGDVDRHPRRLQGDPGPPLPGDRRSEGAARAAQRRRHVGRLRGRRHGADQGEPVQRLHVEPDDPAPEGGQRPLLRLSVTRARSSKMVLNVLTPENGFTEVDTRTYTGPSDTIDVHTYKVDLDKLNIPTDKIYVAADALDRLVTSLEAEPGDAATAAGNLLDRIVPPADGSEAALLARLKTLAGR